MLMLKCYIYLQDKCGSARRNLADELGQSSSKDDVSSLTEDYVIACLALCIIVYRVALVGINLSLKGKYILYNTYQCYVY